MHAVSLDDHVACAIPRDLEKHRSCHHLIDLDCPCDLRWYPADQPAQIRDADGGAICLAIVLVETAHVLIRILRGVLDRSSLRCLIRVRP